MSHAVGLTAKDCGGSRQRVDAPLALLSRERKSAQALAARVADLEAEMQEMQASYEVSLASCCLFNLACLALKQNLSQLR
jgi:hypothetical protein